MRYISETFRKPPRNGERFRDGDRTVEFKIFDKIDESVGLCACDYCCFNDGYDTTCDGGSCVRFEYADMPPVSGYYVKIDEE